MARDFYYVKEVAALLGVTTQWITRKIHRNEIAATRMGRGRWRVKTQVLREYAKTQGVSLDWDALRDPANKPRAPIQSSPQPFVPEATPSETPTIKHL